VSPAGWCRSSDARGVSGLLSILRSPLSVEVTGQRAVRTSECLQVPAQTANNLNAFSLRSTTAPSIDRSARLIDLSVAVLPCTGAVWSKYSVTV
jgi:hypothetical protein